MKIVVIGNAGQLSYELVRILGEDTICLGPEIQISQNLMCYQKPWLN